MDYRDYYSSSEDNNDVDLSSMRSQQRYSQGRQRRPVSKKKRRNKKLIITNCVTSVILFLSIVALCAMTIIPRMSIGGGGSFNITGDDIVKSDNVDVSYILVVGVDASESLTDIIMLVCFDHGKNTASVLQIPRDTFAGNDLANGKINSVYGSGGKGEAGIKKLIQRINSLFGLPIDHVVLVTLSSFRDIVDAVGGVEVDLGDSKLYVGSSTNPDDKYGEDRFYIGPGKVTLSGAEAEGFIRHRKSYAKGDIGRLEATRQFYAQFMKKLIGMSASQALNIAKNCYGDIQSDLTVGQVLGYVEAARKLDLSSIRFDAVPGQGQCYFRGNDCYSVHIDEYIELANKYYLPYGEKLTRDDINAQEIFSSYQSSLADEGGSLNEYQSEDD